MRAKDSGSHSPGLGGHDGFKSSPHSRFLYELYLTSTLNNSSRFPLGAEQPPLSNACTPLPMAAGALLRALAQCGVGSIMPSRLNSGRRFPEPATRTLGPGADPLCGVARSEGEVARRTGLTTSSVLCSFPAGTQSTTYAHGPLRAEVKTIALTCLQDM